MNNVKFVISGHAVFSQKVVLGLSICIIVFFSLFLTVEWNPNYLLVILLAILLLTLANIFSSKFYDIHIEEGAFKMRNLFRPAVDFDVRLFDKITTMNTTMLQPGSPYFTIYFKDGSHFNFARKTFGDLTYLWKDKKELARQQTEAIYSYINE